MTISLRLPRIEGHLAEEFRKMARESLGTDLDLPIRPEVVADLAVQAINSGQGAIERSISIAEVVAQGPEERLFLLGMVARIMEENGRAMTRALQRAAEEAPTPPL
jgi:predicted nucleotidyltransferase